MTERICVLNYTSVRIVSAFLQYMCFAEYKYSKYTKHYLLKKVYWEKRFF